MISLGLLPEVKIIRNGPVDYMLSTFLQKESMRDVMKTVLLISPGSEKRTEVFSSYEKLSLPWNVSTPKKGLTREEVLKAFDDIGGN